MKGLTSRYTERDAAGAPNGDGDKHAGTNLAGKLAPPFAPGDAPGQPQRRELAAVNLQADVAVSYEARGAISPTTEEHPSVGANT